MIPLYARLGLDHEPAKSCLQPGLVPNDPRVPGARDRYVSWVDSGGDCCGNELVAPEEKPMKPAVVVKLEEVLEQAIANALDSKKLKKLPVKPRREITHLMAKAAAAVCEGVVEGKEG